MIHIKQEGIAPPVGTTANVMYSQFLECVDSSIREALQCIGIYSKNRVNFLYDFLKQNIKTQYTLYKFANEYNVTFGLYKSPSSVTAFFSTKNTYKKITVKFNNNTHENI